MQRTDWLIAALGFIFAVIFSLWMIYGVPMNMDEAMPYHMLACLDHPAYFLHTFREGCDERFNLTLPFGVTYSRTYAYMGALDSALYAPFYHLYHSQHVQYVFGLGFFVLFALCLSRLTSKPRLSFFVFLCFFPAMFQFIHDMGPIKFTALVFVVTPLIYKRVIKEKPVLQILAGFLTGVLFTLATEEKVFFVYLLLPLALFVLAEAHVRKGYVHPFVSFARDVKQKPFFPALRALLQNKACGWPFITSLTLMAVLGIGMIFFSKVPGGQTYIGSLETNPQDLGFVLNNVRLYILLWASFARTVWAPQMIPMSGWIELATFAFLAACVLVYRNNRGLSSCPPLRAKLLLASMLSCAVLLIATRGAYGGHHFIFMWFPVMVLFAELLAGSKALQALSLALAYFAINFASVLVLSAIEPDPDTSWKRDTIWAYFNNPDIAAHSIINYSTWGGYYINALYAPREALVTYIEPLNAPDTAKLYGVSRRTGRKIYDVCFGENCTAEKLATGFDHKLRFREVELGLKDWHVFLGENPS